MKRLSVSHLVILTLMGLLVLVGCAQPTPVVILVTPTPESGPVVVADSASPVPTVAVQLSPDALLPTEPPLSSPTQPTRPAITGNATVIGPIIGEDYQAPASFTPLPTTTPAAAATNPPVAPATDAPPASEVPPVTQAPSRTGTSIPSFDTSDVGIQTISFLNQDQWNEVLKQVDNDMQLGWIKVQINWDFFQPNGPGEISEDLRRFEIFIEQARQIRQVKVLISVAKAPDWARSDLSEDGPPDDPQALADFITLLLNEFGQAVDAVEVWNEPNLAREWRGQPLNGASYMRYFDPAHRAIQAYNSNIVIVSAGLAPTGNTDGSRNDREYLQEMYNAGLANYANVAVGVHPYGWGNPPDAVCCAPGPERGWDEFPQFFFLNTLDDYRAIMNNNGHGAVQMWATEFGWATWEDLPGEPPDLWMSYNSKWDQAHYNFRAIEIMQQRGDVGPMFLWNLNFGQPALIDNRDERVAYSIVFPEDLLFPRERPFYWMMYDATRPDEELPRYD